MTQWEINQANLDRLAKPIDDYSDKKLALTLSDIAHDRSNREEIGRENRAEVRQTKRDKEILERHREEKILELSVKYKIKIPKNATDSDIAELVNDAGTRDARNAIGVTKDHYSKRRSEIQGMIKDLTSEKDKILDTDLTPMQRASVLRQTLSDPLFYNAVDPEKRKKVDEFLATNPEKAKQSEVSGLSDEIYKNIKSNKFLFWGAGGSKKADEFSTAYADAAIKKLAGKSLARAEEVYGGLKNAYAESLVNDRSEGDSMEKLLVTHGSFITREMLSEFDPKPPVEKGASSGDWANETGDAGAAPSGVDESAKKLIGKSGGGKTTSTKYPQELTSKYSQDQLASYESALGGDLMKYPPEEIPIQARRAAERKVKDLESQMSGVGASVSSDGKVSIDPLGRPVVSNMGGLGPVQQSIYPKSTAELAKSRESAGAIVPQLQAMRQLLASLTPQQRSEINKFAKQSGKPPSEIEYYANLAEHGDLNFPDTQKALTGAMEIWKAISQVDVPPPAVDTSSRPQLRSRPGIDPRIEKVVSALPEIVVRKLLASGTPYKNSQFNSMNSGDARSMLLKKAMVDPRVARSVLESIQDIPFNQSPPDRRIGLSRSFFDSQAGESVSTPYYDRGIGSLVDPVERTFTPGQFSGPDYNPYPTNEGGFD